MIEIYGGGRMPGKMIEFMRKAGYPLKIKGNGGYEARLVGRQPLLDGEFVGIYRYPGGKCCHSKEEIEKYFDVIER